MITFDLFNSDGVRIRGSGSDVSFHHDNVSARERERTVVSTARELLRCIARTARPCTASIGKSF